MSPVRYEINSYTLLKMNSLSKDLIALGFLNECETDGGMRVGRGNRNPDRTN
jgi:hypothetical protein